MMVKQVPLCYGSLCNDSRLTNVETVKHVSHNRSIFRWMSTFLENTSLYKEHAS